MSEINDIPKKHYPDKSIGKYVLGCKRCGKRFIGHKGDTVGPCCVSLADTSFRSTAR